MSECCSESVRHLLSKSALIETGEFTTETRFSHYMNIKKWFIVLLHSLEEKMDIHKYCKLHQNCKNILNFSVIFNTFWWLNSWVCPYCIWPNHGLRQPNIFRLCVYHSIFFNGNATLKKNTGSRQRCWAFYPCLCRAPGICTGHWELKNVQICKKKPAALINYTFYSAVQS